MHEIRDAPELRQCEKVEMMGFTTRKMKDRNTYNSVKADTILKTKEIAAALGKTDFFSAAQEVVPYSSWFVHFPATFFNTAYFFDQGTKFNWLFAENVQKTKIY